MQADRLASCRDAGNREDRQKARLMWLVEACGVDQFRKNVAQYMGLDDLPGHAHVEYKDEWKRRDVIGIHPQKQVLQNPLGGRNVFACFKMILLDLAAPSSLPIVVFVNCRYCAANTSSGTR